MALSLPYPGLDFVPLDTLRAEQVNRIVANYTYIANQFPIGTANLSTAVQNALAAAGGITPGTVWRPSGEFMATGELTATATSVRITIPIGKSLDQVSTVRVNTLSGGIRCPARYNTAAINGHSIYVPWGSRLTVTAGSEQTEWTAYVSSAVISSPGAVTVTLSANFKCTDANYVPCNNSPVTMALGTSTTLTFN